MQLPPRDFVVVLQLNKKCRRVLLPAGRTEQAGLCFLRAMLHSGDQFATQTAQGSDMQCEVSLKAAHKLPYIGTFPGSIAIPVENCAADQIRASAAGCCFASVKAFCGPTGTLCRAWTWTLKSDFVCPNEGSCLPKGHEKMQVWVQADGQNCACVG